MVDSLQCPKCTHRLDDASCLTPGKEGAQPSNGDISSCLYCGAALVYVLEDSHPRLRLMSEAEILALPPDEMNLLSASMSIGVIVRAKKGEGSEQDS